MRTFIFRWALCRRQVSLVLCCLMMAFSNAAISANASGQADPEKVRLQLQKLRILEAKNLEKIEQYSQNPTAQIKLKSNLVIIRLKISNLLEQLEGSSGPQDTSKSTGTGKRERPSGGKGNK